MIPSAYADTFARDHLPPPEQWPDLIFELPDYRYPDRLNCVTELLDRWLEKGWHDRPCMITGAETITYGTMAERVSRIANVLVKDCGLKSGNRVLLRSANTPQFVAAYLGVMKAGGIAVATMPLLRAKELSFAINKTGISFSLCDHRLAEEMEKAKTLAPGLQRIVYFNSPEDDGLEALMREASPEFTAFDTAADDVCLIGFTSGTTGEPKGTMHFHRDVLLIADGYGKHVLKADESDRFIGSPPLAFTFGLGGLVVFPMRVGASAILLEKATPDDLIAAIDRHKATISFTAPTAYRAMLAKLQPGSCRSLRKCVSAGETLPRAIFDAWHERTQIELMDGIGATEMLHIFIGAPEGKIRGGSTGLPVPGYQAKIIDDKGADVPHGTPGRLAVKGPIGCRYLDDPRQRNYVEQGWNITGDTFIQDEEGYFWYQARSDDMIISAGYNISGPEIENALLTHPAIAECAVIGIADEERGMVPKAFIVLRSGYSGDTQMVKTLQDHVKSEIAPYKYPRRVEFRDALPKTQTGKLQRFALRTEEAKT